MSIIEVKSKDYYTQGCIWMLYYHYRKARKEFDIISSQPKYKRGLFKKKLLSIDETIFYATDKLLWTAADGSWLKAVSNSLDLCTYAEYVYIDSLSAIVFEQSKSYMLKYLNMDQDKAISIIEHQFGYKPFKEIE